MGWIRNIIITVLLAYLSQHFYIWLVNMGVGVHYNNVYPGECRIIPGIECGSEKISVTSDGLAFITNGLKMLTSCNPKYTQGKLYLFDFSAPEDNVVQLKIIHDGKFDLKAFDPHGMDIFESVNDEIVKVYVVNHAHGKESVEVFVYDRKQPEMIEHQKTITNENFVCLNDIAILGDDRFFTTNFVKYCHTSTVLNIIEYFGKLKTANVVFYKRGTTTVVADGGVGLNGIAFHKSKLYVVSNGNGMLHVYDWQENKLSNHQEFYIGHYPDNVFVDKDSDKLYVGTHKTSYALMMAVENKTAVGGTGIKITLNHTWNTVEVEEILHDDGHKFVQGVASVVHHNGQFLFGSIFHKLGYCKDRSLL